MCRILNTFKNWELFSDKQLKDTSAALKAISKYLDFTCTASPNIIIDLI